MENIDNAFKIGDYVRVIDMPVVGIISEIDFKSKSITIEVDNPGKDGDPFFYYIGNNHLSLYIEYCEKVTKQERLLINLKYS